MARVLTLVYGVACYFFFFAVFLYFIGFIADIPVPGWLPKTVSHGGAEGGLGAVLMNIVWMAVFGVQHSVMAREGFKKAIAGVVPAHVERSTFVLASGLALSLVMWQWQPIGGMVWQFDSLLAQVLLWGLFAFGWALIFVATFLTDHFDLFGLRQVYLYFAQKTYTHVEFKTVFLYKMLRHPMMLGLLISFWATPTMTMSHLLFSAGMSVYVFIGIHFEERGLLRVLGKDYAEWRAKTPMVLPF
jgi:methanethiol S-methyltransferase